MRPLLVCLTLLACDSSEHVSETIPKTGELVFQPPPVFEMVGQIDGTTWVKHDRIRHVTCWEFFYVSEGASPSYPRALAGGISCLPDKQIVDPDEATR